MSWTNITKNVSTFVNKARQILRGFWATHDAKYVVDHNQKKIIFMEIDYDFHSKQTASYTNKSKS